MWLQVRDLERRQEKEHAREEAKVAKQLQREASERERQTQVMAQEAAAQLQLQVCLITRFESTIKVLAMRMRFYYSISECIWPIKLCFVTAGGACAHPLSCWMRW